MPFPLAAMLPPLPLAEDLLHPMPAACAVDSWVVVAVGASVVVRMPRSVADVMTSCLALVAAILAKADCLTDAFADEWADYAIAVAEVAEWAIVAILAVMQEWLPPDAVATPLVTPVLLVVC